MSRHVPEDFWQVIAEDGKNHHKAADMFHLIVELVVREQCVPFVEEESPQRFPFFRARADCVKTLEVVFYVEVYQVIFHRERVALFFRNWRNLASELHPFHESIPIATRSGSRNLAGRVACDENTGECPHPVLRDG